MNISDETKRLIVMNILDIILGISDKEYQKRVWIKGEGPEVDDFDETCCGLFDDNDIDFVLKNYSEYSITKDQYNILNKFRDEFRSFSDENNWPPEFIDTPEWEKITEMAKEVLKAFNYTKRRKQ